MGSIAGAASSNVLGPNQVVTASSSVGGLTTPTDGRLRGPDFSIDVTGVAWPAEADGYEASTGQRLVVVSLPIHALSSSVDPSSLSLAVTSPGHSAPLDFFSKEAQANGGSLLPGPSQVTYVVSVPNATHHIELGASEGSFSQTFSLWTLKRTSSAPTVLYADPATAKPSVNIGATLSVPITNSADGVTVSSNLIVSKATFSAFNPVGNVPAPDGSAYVTMSMSSGPPQLNYGDPTYGHFFSGLTPLPGSAITLTPKGGAPVPATQSNPVDQSDNPNSSSDDGMVDATYSFLVPLSEPELTLSIGPATTSGTEFTGFVGGDSVPLQVGGPVTTSFAVPAITTVAHQRTPPWVGQPNPPTGTVSAGGGQTATVSSGDGGITIPIAIGVLVLVGVGAFIARKRGLLGGQAQAASTSTETLTTVAPVADVVVVETQGSVETDPTLHVNVLGPLIITPRRGQVTAPVDGVVSYLALHGERPRSAGEIQTALWPDSADVHDVTKKTFHNYISKVRQAIGASHLPDATPRGYELVDTETDLDRFVALMEEVSRLDSVVDGDVARDLRIKAVALLRGQPFEAEESEFLAWVTLDGTKSRIARTVVQICHDHAIALLGVDLLDEAELVLRGGLKVVPHEVVLWEDLTAIVQRRDDPTALRHHFEDAAAVLDDDEVAQLRDLVDS